MTDNHVHIGQFENVYYEARRVFDTVLASGEVTRIIYSSTTTCKAGARYADIAHEVEQAAALLPPEKATPLFWFIPAYIDEGINIEGEMKNLPYGGFKLHPYAHKWTFHHTPSGDKSVKQCEALHIIFNYAQLNDLPVLIHTGESGSDAPGRFKLFFDEYPGAEVILAHGRPAGETLEMMRRFQNVRCDTAFMPESAVKEIARSGFADRIVTGSDFPITHYFTNRDAAGSEVTPAEQYRRDTAQMRKYTTIIERYKNVLPSEV